jgi:Arc/MetJ family transcription regulator
MAGDSFVPRSLASIFVTTTRLSVTLDSDLVAEAKRQVGQRGVSRYVGDALRLRLQRDQIVALPSDAELRTAKERAAP